MANVPERQIERREPPFWALARYLFFQFTEDFPSFKIFVALSVTNCLNNLKKGLVSAIGIPLESGTLPVLNAASPLGYLSLLPVEFHVSSAMFRILFDWTIHTSKKATLGIINLREFRDLRASASQVYHVSLYMIYSMHPDFLAFFSSFHVCFSVWLL